MRVLQYIADNAGDICQIATCAALIIKPIREWLMGTADLRDGQKSLLRTEIVRIYYRHHDDRKLREFEYKNMEECYKAYKSLKGNSFVDRIHAEMQEWDII